MQIIQKGSLALFCAFLACPAAFALSLDEEFGNQAKEYEQLFNDGKSAALADLWSEDGGLETADGSVFRGRKEIQGYFQNYFDTSGKNRKLKVKITSLKEPGTNTVIEQGVTSDTTSDDAKSSYTVVHFKGSEGWKMSWVSERQAPGSPISIKDFQWLCGRWKANSNQATPVTMQVRLIENGNFLECTTSGADGKSDARQIIGYNPLMKTLMSFHFDSQGGMGRGMFRKQNGAWSQVCTGVLPNGTVCSSVNTLTPSSKDTITWRSTGRTVGGVAVPDTEIVTLNRVAE